MINKKWIIILAAILIVGYLGSGEKLAKKTSCTVPENAEVLFRTNVAGSFGNFLAAKDTTWIALKFDTVTQSETSNLVTYRFHNVRLSCTENATSIPVYPNIVLPFVANNGAALTYKQSTTTSYIYVYDPTGCPEGKYTWSWYSYNNTIPSELSSSPTEPYSSNCQETYKITTPPTTSVYPAFLASKDNYLGGGVLAEFITQGNEWVIS